MTTMAYKSGEEYSRVLVLFMKMSKVLIYLLDFYKRDVCVIISRISTKK